MKGGSSSFGEREEDMALLQSWKTADKIWAGCFTFVWEPLLSGASLGSPPGLQTSSRRMSRPALRLTCFFSLSAFPKHQPPGGHKAALSLNSYSLSWIWLACLNLKAGKGKKGPSLDSFLPRSSPLWLPKLKKVSSTKFIWEKLVFLSHFPFSSSIPAFPCVC